MLLLRVVSLAKLLAIKDLEVAVGISICLGSGQRCGDEEHVLIAAAHVVKLGHIGHVLLVVVDKLLIDGLCIVLGMVRSGRLDLLDRLLVEVLVVVA